MEIKEMKELLIITPVKNSITLTEQTIRSVVSAIDKQHWKYVVYDDFCAVFLIFHSPLSLPCIFFCKKLLLLFFEYAILCKSSRDTMIFSWRSTQVGTFASAAGGRASEQ